MKGLVYSDMYTRQVLGAYDVVYKFNTMEGQRFFEEIRRRDGASRYIVSYATKLKQKTVPVDYRDVGRFWGCSRNLPMEKGEEFDIDEATLRDVLRKSGQGIADWGFIPKVVIIRK